MRSNSRLTKLAFSLAVTFVLLLGAELFARIALRPPLDLGSFVPWHEMEFTPPINALGFRESSSPPEAGALRVLFLGDSFTFGQGIARGEDRFTDLIEARWNETIGPMDAFNAGVPGSNPARWGRDLKRLIRNYRPNAVVAVFFLRDGTSLATSMHFHKQRIERLKAKYSMGWLTRVSRLAQAVGDHRAAREFTSWYLEQFRVAYVGTAEQRRVWIAMQRELLDIKRRCEAAGAEFHLVVFPLLFGLSDYAYAEAEAEIEGFARRNGIPSFSLTPGFLGRNERDLWVAPGDQHPNELGHRIAADTLFPYLRSALTRSRPAEPRSRK